MFVSLAMKLMPVRADFRERKRILLILSTQLSKNVKLMPIMTLCCVDKSTAVSDVKIVTMLFFIKMIQCLGFIIKWQ